MIFNAFDIIHEIIKRENEIENQNKCKKNQLLVFETEFIGYYEK